MRMHLDDAQSSTGGWQRQKDLLESKVDQLNKAYQESLQAQRDGQTQSVNLLTQVRDRHPMYGHGIDYQIDIVRADTSLVKLL